MRIGSFQTNHGVGSRMFLSHPQIRGAISLAERGGDSFRRYRAKIVGEQYPSVLGPTLFEQSSCFHRKEHLNSLYSVTLHPASLGPFNAGDRHNLGDREVTVFQGVFGRETCERPHTYPKVDLLVDDGGVLCRAVYEHQAKYPNEGAMVMHHDQSAQKLWRAGIFELSYPHIAETLKYFFAFVEETVLEGVSIPESEENGADDNGRTFPAPEEVADKIAWYVGRGGRPNLMMVRDVFNCPALDRSSFSELKKLVRQTIFLIHPDRNPNDPMAEEKIKFLINLIALIMEDSRLG